VRLRTYQTEGIIIKRFNFGEADKILTIFSKHYGKIRALAKGVRKLTSRKAASLELFNLAVIFLVKGKNLDIITEAKIIDSFSSWRKDLKKIAFAYQFCELVDRLTADNQSNRRIFTLLKQSLFALTKKEIDREKLSLNFKKQLLRTTGFGLPDKITNRVLDNHIEKIIEKKVKCFYG